MYHMKGRGRTVIRCENNDLSVELAAFGDGSLAIRTGGRTHSVWEADERDDCLRTFGTLAGLGHEDERGAGEVPLVVMVKRGTLDGVIQDVTAN